MSTEAGIRVAVSEAQAGRVRALQSSAAAVLARQEHAPLGDQTEVQRLEQIQAELDGIAYAEIAAQATGAPPVASDLVLEVAWPSLLARPHTLR